MRKSSKILLLGLLMAMALIGVCLYVNLEKFTDESTSQFIEVASEEEAVDPVEKIIVPIKETIGEEEVAVQKIVELDEDIPLKEENKSLEAIELSTLLYKIEDQNITIDGRLPILEDDDKLKEMMMQECVDFSCDRRVLFSPKQLDPEWRSLAIETIKLFHEDGLPSATFLVENKKIMVNGHFKHSSSKEKLDTLLKDYESTYDINNSTSIEVLSKKEKPESLIKAEDEEPTEVDSNGSVDQLTKVEKIQESISAILKRKHINFQRSRSRITKKGKETLNEIIEILKSTPDIQIEVQGYTDAAGRARINKWVSQKRANSVKKYLGSHGLNPKNITAKGFGETKFLIEKEPYNKLNRRVEIVIKKEKK